jgi:hypothetical protein
MGHLILHCSNTFARAMNQNGAARYPRHNRYDDCITLAGSLIGRCLYARRRLESAPEPGPASA